MTEFHPGELVGIPADVAGGAFPDECFVTIHTVSGPVSGFVARQNILGEGNRVKGVVRDVTEDTVVVWIQGSFFTTTGLAYLPRSWAQSNLAPSDQV